jgi:hypothetical protein
LLPLARPANRRLASPRLAALPAPAHAPRAAFSRLPAPPRSFFALKQVSSAEVDEWVRRAEKQALGGKA